MLAILSPSSNPFFFAMSQLDAQAHVSIPNPFDGDVSLQNGAFGRVPGIQRIDNGSILEIFKFAVSLPEDVKNKDVLRSQPRGYLGRVCRSWYAFFGRHPSLSTTVGVFGDVPSQVSRLAHFDLLDSWVDSCWEQVHEAWGVGAVDAVNAVRERVRSLVVHLRWRSSLDCLGNVFNPQTYPILERLDLDASIDDAGLPSLSNHAQLIIGRLMLTTLTVDAKILLDLRTTTQGFIHLLGGLTSLTIIHMFPNTSGFPDDGMGQIVELAGSLPLLASLTLYRLTILEGTLGIELWRCRPATPYPIPALVVKRSNAVAYELRRPTPHVTGKDVERSILPMISSFTGSRLTIRDCAFLMHRFLHLVHGWARLNLISTAFPGLRHLHIEECPLLSIDGLFKFLSARSAHKAATTHDLEILVKYKQIVLKIVPRTD
ncbi:hypothetical protein DFP72DRAFT_1078395 [Ephemerocybe angulata]|uniref:Uncharacterized protein n=1 Tax=Ephemerocybe angulata TaxID=980116 RepID=A0A8H6LX95_9AGAR|nr:hypothetical protein DFP72DRAFT_1078395 [Tulosesus angulatus]